MVSPPDRNILQSLRLRGCRERLYLCLMRHIVKWLAPRVAVSLCLIGTAGLAQAQEAPSTIRLQSEDLARGTNGPQLNFYFLPPGVEGEKYQSAGFFGQKLRPYLAGNEEALDNLNRYRRQKTLFLINRLVAVGAIGLYGQQVLSKTGEEQYFNSTQQVALGVFGTSLLATVFINRNTNRHMQRAVSAYNAADVHGALWPRLRPSSIGLGQAATGQPVVALRWSLR